MLGGMKRLIGALLLCQVVLAGYIVKLEERLTEMSRATRSHEHDPVDLRGLALRSHSHEYDRWIDDHTHRIYADHSHVTSNFFGSRLEPSALDEAVDDKISSAIRSAISSEVSSAIRSAINNHQIYYH